MEFISLGTRGINLTLFDEDLKKGKKYPIGTVSNGYKKVAEGKWVPVKNQSSKDSSSKTDKDSKPKGKNGYVVQYNGKRVDVYADSLYEAKKKGLKELKVPKSKMGLVSTTLAETNGKKHTHVADKSESIDIEKAESTMSVGTEYKGWKKTSKGKWVRSYPNSLTESEKTEADSEAQRMRNQSEYYAKEARVKSVFAKYQKKDHWGYDKVRKMRVKQWLAAVADNHPIAGNYTKRDIENSVNSTERNLFYSIVSKVKSAMYSKDFIEFKLLLKQDRELTIDILEACIGKNIKRSDKSLKSLIESGGKKL